MFTSLKFTNINKKKKQLEEIPPMMKLVNGYNPIPQIRIFVQNHDIRTK